LHVDDAVGHPCQQRRDGVPVESVSGPGVDQTLLGQSVPENRVPLLHGGNIARDGEDDRHPLERRVGVVAKLVQHGGGLARRQMVHFVQNGGQETRVEVGDEKPAQLGRRVLEKVVVCL